MGVMAYQITSPTIVYSTVYLSADQRKPQSSASLAFVSNDRWIPRSNDQYETVFIWWRHHDPSTSQVILKVMDNSGRYLTKNRLYASVN